MYLSGLALLSLAGFAIVAVLSAVRDIRTKAIPDGLSLTLLVGYLLLAAGAGWSQTEITSSLLGAALVFFAGLLMVSMGWISTDIAKFAAVCMLWLGAHLALPFLGLTLGLSAFAFLIVKTLPRLQSRLGRRETPTHGSHSLIRSQSLPVGYVLGATALFLIPQSPWVASVI